MPQPARKPAPPRRSKTLPDVQASTRAKAPPAPLRRAKSSKDVIKPARTPAETPAASGKPVSAARRLKRENSQAAIADACAGSDERKLEYALREGFEAGVADDEIVLGLVRAAEMAEAKQAAIEKAKQERERAERERLAQEEAQNAKPVAPPREGSMVKLTGLSHGIGPLGVGSISLEQHNGRVGRVTAAEDVPRFAVQTALYLETDKAVLTSGKGIREPLPNPPSLTRTHIMLSRSLSLSLALSRSHSTDSPAPPPLPSPCRPAPRHARLCACWRPLERLRPAPRPLAGRAHRVCGGAVLEGVCGGAACPLSTPSYDATLLECRSLEVWISVGGRW